MTDPTPPNMSVDEMLEQFDEGIASFIATGERDIALTAYNEAKAALSALFDTFAERVIGKYESDSKLQTIPYRDIPIGDIESVKRDSLRTEQRARVPEIKKELGL